MKRHERTLRRTDPTPIAHPCRPDNLLGDLAWHFERDGRDDIDLDTGTAVPQQHRAEAAKTGQFMRYMAAIEYQSLELLRYA